MKDASRSASRSARSSRAGAIALAALLAAAALPARAAGDVPLPSEADVPPQLNPTALLGPKPGEFPNRAPGPITGRETVRVALRPDGAVSGIVVEQALTVRGTGDYTIEIPGPATDVTAPDGARAKPGLRRGAVIWEGFSPGERELAATITLDLERQRFTPLPVAVTVAAAGDGWMVILRNDTAASRRVRAALPDRRALGSALEAIRGELAGGRAPMAGTGAVPATLPADGSVVDTAEQTTVALRVTGTIGTGANAVPLDVLLPSRDAPEGEARFAFDGADAPAVTLRAVRALPEPPVPPDGGSWTAALALASEAQLRDALRTAAVTLWQVLRMREYDAFLGNPLGGASEAEFLYAPAEVVIPSPPPPAERARWWAIALALLGLVALGAGAGVWWARN